jgi:HAE1 family hydrophobic/amphiphilic exporter-1
VIVFVPVLTLDLPVGQLFRDIGIAISVSVLISVVVSVTVIPTLAARLLGGAANRFEKLPTIPVLDPIARRFAGLFIGYAQLVVRRKLVGFGIVAIVLASAFGFSAKLMPKLDYLPDGNANFIFGRISVPAGYSMEETLRIAERMERAARPLWQGEVTEGVSLLPIHVGLFPVHQLQIRRVFVNCEWC